MTRTLRTLIETRDFTGYTVQEDSWALDADQIEDLLYSRSYGDWNTADEHLTAFYESEKLSSVDINTWICTDTRVGLQILCLNGVPFALSWQVGRKCDREIELLNQESYNFLKYAWEKHRVSPKNNTNFLTDAVLDIPVSGSNDKAYPIDQSSDLSRLALSAYGVALWMKDIKPDGGLASVTHPNVLRACIQGVEFDIHMHQRSVENTEKYLETHSSEQDVSTIETTVAEFKERIAFLTKDMLEPLQTRLAELEAEPSAS
jgi:hypothetical protein